MKGAVADRSKHNEDAHRWPENEILSHHSVSLHLSSHGDMLCFYKQGAGNKVTSLDEGCRFRSQDGFTATAKLALLSTISPKTVTVTFI